MENSYQLIDSGHLKKLEQIGPYRIVRPALGAVWSPKLSASYWSNPDAIFERNASGKGHWKYKKEPLGEWNIQIGSLTFVIQLTDFGHIGLFAEQAKNWALLEEMVSKIALKDPDTRVLNLFAYTGGSSLACAKGGAKVTHLDASKTSVAWGKQNANASKLNQDAIRWITDDVTGFVEREVRRKTLYNGVILDPPSFGRGTKSQLWKIEDHLVPLLKNIKKILKPEKSFVLLSSHSPGYTPISLENLLLQEFPEATSSSNEMLIFEKTGRGLPSGASCLMTI